MKSQQFLDLTRSAIEAIGKERNVNIQLSEILRQINHDFSTRYSGISARIKEAGKKADIFGSVKTGKPDQLVQVAEADAARLEARNYALFLLDGEVPEEEEIVQQEQEKEYLDEYLEQRSVEEFYQALEKCESLADYSILLSKRKDLSERIIIRQKIDELGELSKHQPIRLM